MLTGHVDILTRSAVSGWAADDESPGDSVSIDILVNGDFYCSIIANELRQDIASLGKFGEGLHGFSYSFEPELSEDKTVQIEVRHTRTSELLGNGVVFFPNAKYEETVLPRLVVGQLQPVIVSAMGRTGSSILMHRLSSHPQIVVGGGQPYEMMLGNYYSVALRILTAQGDWINSLHPDRLGEPPFGLGFNPYYHPEFRYGFSKFSGAHAFQHAYVAPLLQETFAKIVATQYAVIAHQKKKCNAILFAEKFRMQRENRSAMAALFPTLKEIFLVRDIRDVYCSFRSYFHVEGERLISDLRGSVRDAQRAYAHDISTKLVVKYEDLVCNSTDTLLKISMFLELKDDFQSNYGSEVGLFQAHGTSTSPDKSIGRWREELTTLERQTVEREFAEYQSLFNYS